MCMSQTVIADYKIFIPFSDHFRVLGRAVHLNFLKEQLQKRGVNFANPVHSKDLQPVITVDVLADSVYLQVRISTLPST